MSATTHKEAMIPPVLLRAVGALVLSSLLIATYARVTDRPLVASPPESAAVDVRVLTLGGDLSGAVRVGDADGALLFELSPEEGGFVSGIARVVARERALRRLPDEGPVQVVRHANGRISVADPLTGWSADLMGFGLDNAKAFASLLAI